MRGAGVGSSTTGKTMTRRKSATANLTSVECVDCAGPLDAASRARCSGLSGEGRRGGAPGEAAPGAGGGRREAAGRGGAAGCAEVGARGPPGRDRPAGEPGTVRAIGRRAVVSAVNNGGRWVLASAIRILDGEARPIDVERLQRVASAWRQAGSPVKRAGSTWAPRLEPKRRGAEPPELAGSRDRSAFA